MDYLKTNSFKVVGRLSSQDLEVKNRKDNGDAFISGKAIIIAELDGAKNEFEVSFYANKKTADGKDSSLFTSYSKLAELVGKKVEITGSISESRFWSTNANQMVSAQQLNGRFVHGVAESTSDEGTFELGGFVVKGLTERLNKNNEVYRYDLTIGQANYRGDNMACFTAHINPADRDIVNGVRGYEVGQTVRINGDLRFIVTETRSERKNEGGFGEPVVRVYTNRQRNFFITGGTAAIKDPEQGMYPADVIRTLVGAYKAHDVELSEKAKSSAPAQEAEPEVRVTSKQTSLI